MVLLSTGQPSNSQRRTVSRSSLARAGKGQFARSHGGCSHAAPSSIGGTPLTRVGAQVLPCGPHPLKDRLSRGNRCLTPAHSGPRLTCVPLCVAGTLNTLELTEGTELIMGLSEAALQAGAFMSTLWGAVTLTGHLAGLDRKRLTATTLSVDLFLPFL